LAPLRVDAFGRLLFGYTLNSLGDFVGIVALAVLVYDGSQSAPATAALFIAAKFLPGLVAPIITARVDQLGLRRTLPAMYAIEALVFGLLAVIASGEELLLPLILVLAFVDGSLAVSARGLTRSGVAALLQPTGLLASGNALMNVGFALASVGGAALGGLLVSEAGVATALIADAASFLTIAVVLALTQLPPAHLEREHWYARLRDGVRFVRREPFVRLLLTGEALALVLFTMILPIEVIYAKQSLETTSAGFGILLAAWGAGIVIGSALYVAIKNRSTVALILISTSAIGLAYVGLAVAQTLLVACLVSVFGGCGNGIQWIAVMTALQESTPLELQARITGLMESLGAIMPGIGYMIGATITALGSARLAYAVAGGGVMVLVFIALAAQARAVSRRRRTGTATA
jgi:MFS family permease